MYLQLRLRGFAGLPPGIEKRLENIAQIAYNKEQPNHIINRPY